ncbi:nicotinate-nucleotide adenylyltransferase [Uliginosibacterium paludis]|uniref:Probable nicotinate-nucleotide adenylyltransferase n=1 Tax=Uliginosibacterium paludis TaxID=1615952 RepID=A0ABV2CSU0_9RHOO
MSPTGPLGILGGTFDPIHAGHLRMALEARDALGLEVVRLIPAGQPPHRGQPGTPAADRLRMVELAVAGVPELEVDPAEVLAPQASYTILTLERLRHELGANRPLVLLMGADAFLGLAGWHRWQELFAHAHVAVATRPGYSLQAQQMDAALATVFQTRFCEDARQLATRPAGLISGFSMTPLAISATSIRDHLALGRSPRFLVPDPVLDYIQDHHLYPKAPV